MKMNKEQINKLVDDTLDSIKGIGRARSNPFLYSKVMKRIEDKERTGLRKFSFNYTFKLVAVFAVLAVLNAFTLLMYMNSSAPGATDKQDINSFIYEYSLDNTTYYY